VGGDYVCDAARARSCSPGVLPARTAGRSRLGARVEPARLRARADPRRRAGVDELDRGDRRRLRDALRDRQDRLRLHRRRDRDAGHRRGRLLLDLAVLPERGAGHQAEAKAGLSAGHGGGGSVADGSGYAGGSVTSSWRGNSGAASSRGSWSTASSTPMSSPVAAPRSRNLRAAGSTRDSIEPTALLNVSVARFSDRPMSLKWSPRVLSRS